MPRQTAAEKRRQREALDARAWEHFRTQMAELQTMVAAHQFVLLQSPPPDAPGRAYYANFAFFLGGFWEPDGANSTELALYRSFIKRITAELKPGVEQRVVASLDDAIGKRTASGR